MKIERLSLNPENGEIHLYTTTEGEVAGSGKQPFIFFLQPSLAQTLEALISLAEGQPEEAVLEVTDEDVTALEKTRHAGPRTAFSVYQALNTLTSEVHTPEHIIRAPGYNPRALRRKTLAQNIPIEEIRKHVECLLAVCRIEMHTLKLRLGLPARNGVIVNRILPKDTASGQWVLLASDVEEKRVDYEQIDRKTTLMPEYAYTLMGRMTDHEQKISLGELSEWTQTLEIHPGNEEVKRNKRFLQAGAVIVLRKDGRDNRYLIANRDPVPLHDPGVKRNLVGASMVHSVNWGNGEFIDGDPNKPISILNDPERHLALPALLGRQFKWRPDIKTQCCAFGFRDQTNVGRVYLWFIWKVSVATEEEITRSEYYVQKDFDKICWVDASELEEEHLSPSALFDRLLLRALKSGGDVWGEDGRVYVCPHALARLVL